MSSEKTAPILKVYEATLESPSNSYRCIFIAATSLSSATVALKSYFPNEEPRYVSCKGQLVCAHESFPEGLPPDQYTAAVLKN